MSEAHHTIKRDKLNGREGSLCRVNVGSAGTWVIFHTQLLEI